MVINWSSIGKIGNSAIAKATIVAPVLGTFILYNREIKQFLLPMAPAAGSVSQNRSFIIELSSFARIHSIELIYLGLMLMGVATLLYQLFAPNQVKDSSSAMAYALKHARANAAMAVETEFTILVHEVSRFSSASTTEQHRAENLLLKIFQNVDFTALSNRHILPNLGRGLVDGNVISARLIAKEAIFRNGRLLQVLSDEAQNCALDVYYCHYLLKDSSRSIIKLPIYGMMLTSLALLASPTIATFIMIIGGFNELA